MKQLHVSGEFAPGFLKGAKWSKAVIYLAFTITSVR
jgi:hypothetical protein